MRPAITILAVLAACSDEPNPPSILCEPGETSGCVRLPSSALNVGGTNPNLACPARVPGALDAQTTIDGQVWAVNFDSGVVGATVEVFEDLDLKNSLVRTTTGPAGQFSVTLAPGTSDVLHWLATGMEDHINAIALYATVTGDPIALETLAIVCTGGGCVPAPDQGLLTGRVRDCDGVPLSGAIIILTTTPAEARLPDRDHLVADARVRYFIDETTAVPATDLSQTAGPGRFVVDGIAPSQYTAQVWGFLTDEDVLSGLDGLTMVGAQVTTAPAATNVFVTLDPTEGPFD